MKKRVLAALLAASMLALTACGGSSTTQQPAAETPAAEAEADNEAEAPAEEVAPTGGTESLAVSIASEPDTIDPALNSAVDGGTMIIHLMAGLAKWEQNASGAFEIVPDVAESLPEGVVNEDGTVTYTYTLKDSLWSDGQPVTAGDFVFAWNRAAGPALGADYGYMFEVVDGYASLATEEGEPVEGAALNVTAVDDKTLEVTLTNEIPYWNELLAFPCYMPVREDVVANEAWATDPSTYIGNGPYVLSDWVHNSVITMTKNENYFDAANVTMPEIQFFLSDDANNMLANFENGSWLLIDDVPTNEIASLKENYPDEFKIEGQLGTYYAAWNINKEILPEGSGLTGEEAEKAREEIRRAVALLIDRNYIVNDVAQGGQVPASSFVSMGLTDADGKTEFYQNTGVSSSFTGYYDVTEDALESNYAEAVEILKKYYTFDEASQTFTDVPTFEYLYNTNEAHQAIGEYIQSAVSGVGINMTLDNQEWATFLNTRKEGNYMIARNGWLCDYNDPISMLDMWSTNSGNNDIQYGRDAHKDLKLYSIDLTECGYEDKVENGTWAETYDVLISRIKSCTDKEARFKMMHMAEDLIMQTGCITPIYYYTDLYMVSSKVDGFYANPLGFKYFMYSTITE